MVFEIFVDNSLSSKSLLKESNKILNKKKKRFQRNNSIFCKPDGNYVISIFDKRIRISLTNNFKYETDIIDITQYLSNILNGKTVFVSNGNDFKKIFTTLENINIVEV